MEIIFEFLFELILGGFADASGSPKLPKWLRIIFLSILTVPLIILMIILGINTLKDNNNIGFLICTLIGILMIVLWLLGLRKILKT